MHDMQGIPHDEIAKVVGVSVGTVRRGCFMPGNSYGGFREYMR